MLDQIQSGVLLSQFLFILRSEENEETLMISAGKLVVTAAKEKQSTVCMNYCKVKKVRDNESKCF